ncbi:MAG: arginyl-tRNA synthetase [Fimbriimonadaceae bacterium]|nr:arginyl-tRNA synthetase [Fimbriimonadaceae bacterium]
MLRQELAEKVSEAQERLIAAGELPAASRVDFEILDTKSPEHGDYATNLALIAAKPAGMNPRQIGEKLQAELKKDETFDAVDLAGPGFLNLRLKPEVINKYVSQVLDLGDSLSSAIPQHRNTATPQRIEVEFVSVNPNGPITVGSARGAAFGDTLCRALEAAGGEVDREYYINDGVNSEQMRLFAESVRHYVLDKTGKASTFPEKGYKGDYVADVATRVIELHGNGSADQAVSWFQTISQELMLERQRTDLHNFGIDFDIWFSEQKDLHDRDKVKQAVKWLEEQGHAYWATKAADADEDPEDEIAKEESAFPQDATKEALWLRSSEFGDDKDRVLMRADGRPTYLAAEVGYLKDKFDRAYDKCYLVLGPDHHGYIGRTYAVCKTLGKEPGKDFEIVIFQIVRFVKDGKPAPMRKRDGNIYELRDLITELGEAVAPNATKEEQQRTGADVARFFYLMRSHDTHMDFDIDLATKQSDENPVFYVQYAHARISGVLRKAVEAGIEVLGSYGIEENRSDLNAQRSTINASLLTHPRELTLIKKILDLPEEVQRVARDYGVHRIATYAIELARTFHHFYDACRVIQPEEPELTQARLALVKAAQIALKSALTLLGVSAPDRMERAEAQPEA